MDSFPHGDTVVIDMRRPAVASVLLATVALAVTEAQERSFVSIHAPVPSSLAVAFAGKCAAGKSTQFNRTAHRIAAIDGPRVGDRERLPLGVSIERKVDLPTLDRSGQVRFAEVR